MTEFCQREIMKSWIVLLCELFSIWPTAQETGEGDAIVISHRTKPCIYFRMIPVSLANLEYQSRMDIRLSAFPPETGCPRCRWRRGIIREEDANWNGSFQVGKYCRHGGKAIPASWIVISSQTKQNWVRYDMFANVHGWIVRPRFRTVCGTMRQNSVRHTLKSRVAHGYCIGCAECGRWHVRAGVRYVGMGWWWQHARDEICGATIMRFRLAGHTGQGLHGVMPDSIVSLPSSGWFQKKCGAVTTVLFFLFSRASHSWRRTIPEARRGMPETAICTWFVLVAGTYMKMRNLLSYLYVHIGSNSVIETWVRWVLPFGLLKKYYTLTLWSIMKFEH